MPAIDTSTETVLMMAHALRRGHEYAEESGIMSVIVDYPTARLSDLLIALVMERDIAERQVNLWSNGGADVRPLDNLSCGGSGSCCQGPCRARW